MLINILDLLELLRFFELWDVWKDARDATEGTRLYRWRYVVQGLVLLIVLPVVLLLPMWFVFYSYRPRKRFSLTALSAGDYKVYRHPCSPSPTGSSRHFWA